MSKDEETTLRLFFEKVVGKEGYLNIRLLRGSKEENNEEARQMFYLAKNPPCKKLLQIKDWNVHFGVCPRSKKVEEGEVVKLGKEEAVHKLYGFWADVDLDGHTKEEIRERIDGFELKPSVIVDSGHGYQCYWLLTEPMPIDNDSRDLARGILKGLAEKLKGDHVIDLGRVMRVPFTLNLKEKENLIAVKLVEFTPERKYYLAEMERFYQDPGVSKSVDIELETAEVPDRFWRLLEEDEKLQETFQGQRSDLNDTSRSGYDMALAALLAKEGFNENEVAAILIAAPYNQGKKMRKQYLAHTLGKVFAQKEEAAKKKTGKKKPSKRKFNPRPYSEAILSEHFLKYDKYKRFWIYDKEEGIWTDTAELVLNSILRKQILGSEDYKRYCVDEVVADLQGLTYTGKLLKEPEPHLIPFANKIYDLKHDTLLDYSPEYFFINKLAVDIDGANRECPTIDRIFRELVKPKDVVTLYEILAYCFYRKYPYPKMFILYGSGGNGKSRYIDIIMKVLGEKNVSLTTSNDLQFNRFATSQLHGKMLNVSGEMTYTMLKNTSKLKQCTGEDEILCERKFKEPFPFKNHAKMVFITNQVPLTSDKTYAFYRRVFFVEFPHKFIEGENADPMIVEKIPQKEFGGLAWKCMQKLKELHSRGFVFTNHERTELVAQEYEDLSNPLNKFLEEYTKKDVSGDIAVGEFNERYISYLKEKGFREWTPKEINKAMKNKGFEQKKPHIIEDGRETTYRAWVGLNWK